MSWFVLNFIPPHPGADPEKYVSAFNAADRRPLRLFAPRVPDPRLSAAVSEAPCPRLLTGTYVFVEGALSDIKDLCAVPGNGLSLLIDYSSSQRYAVVPDSTMRSFMAIARLHEDALPLRDISGIDLEEGDLVRIIGGRYDGLTGTFLPRHRSNKGDLVIAATPSIGAIIPGVESRHARILRFAPGTRRQYDILEAFLPRLLPILDKYKLGTPLAPKEKSLLSVFNLRMGAVTPENPKIEAKLLATLICVQTILGDTASIPLTRQRFDRCRPSVTNPATLSLIARLLSLPATPSLPSPSALSLPATTSLPSPSALSSTPREAVRFNRPHPVAYPH